MRRKVEQAEPTEALSGVEELCREVYHARLALGMALDMLTEARERPHGGPAARAGFTISDLEDGVLDRRQRIVDLLAELEGMGPVPEELRRRFLECGRP